MHAPSHRPARSIQDSQSPTPAWGAEDVLAFWFGRSDEVAPDVIRNAAIESLQSGETFYAQNCGLPELREALAQYTRGYSPFGGGGHQRIVVTSGGVSRAHAGRAGAGGCRDEAGDHHPGVAQSGGATHHHRGRRCAACHCSRRAGPGGWTCLGSQDTSPSARGC